jgi:hypothetical protein
MTTAFLLLQFTAQRLTDVLPVESPQYFGFEDPAAPKKDRRALDIPARPRRTAKPTSGFRLADPPNKILSDD